MTKRMMPRRPGVIGEEARFLKEHTDRRVKVCLPSPYLIGQRMWEPEHSRSAYATRATFTDPEAEMRKAVDWLNRIVDGVDGVTLAVHLCRRNWGRRGWGAAGGYEAILDHVKRLKVSQLMMEFSIPVAGDVAILKELPPSVHIGLGCVDVRFPEIDPPERIVERVQKALAHVAPERLSLNPDCGFAPGKDHEIPLEEAYAKLKNLAASARMLRGYKMMVRKSAAS